MWWLLGMGAAAVRVAQSPLPAAAAERTAVPAPALRVHRLQPRPARRVGAR
jgi:hypothetical protein